MKLLFRLFSPKERAPWARGQRQPTSIQHRRFLWGCLLCGLFVLMLGLGASRVVAQNESDIKQAEDQVIRQYVLPSPPKQSPVYKPAPTAPARSESPSRSTPTRASTPRRRTESEAPAPRPRQNAAPQAAPRSAPQAAPAPVRRSAPRPQPAEAPEPEEIEETPAPESITETETDTDTESLPPAQYVMQFNRSPVVGNRFRLQGIYSQARLGFTRPRGWDIKSVKANIRYQHSPALLASRSNLTVQVNGTSVGSIPLNRQESQIGQALFNVPPKLIQDYNEVTLVAQQNNDPKCSDPTDPTLWTEVLPDSKLLFEYQPQAIPLNLTRYPYPFFDDLSLEPNRIVYLLPSVSDAWLTAAPRFQAALGRLADFRPIETRLVQDVDDVEPNERLVVIGTPADQPVLKSLDLPFAIPGNQVLDGNKSPLPDDVGLLMLTTTQKGSVPVLVVTGNGAAGVTKAAQFLVQPDTSKLAAGQAVVVTDLKNIPTPSPRKWPLYLPEQDNFTLKDLATAMDGKAFQDITVRGSSAPPIEIDFRALPDDQFTRGSSMNLVYSYGPQVNPRLSAVEVLLNDENVFVGGARLTNENGATRQTLKVDLPANLIKPDSKIKVAFRLNPKEPPECGKITDQQLTGTVHADTSFQLRREKSVRLPDLALLQSGFPFAAPQDLSSTAMVVPDSPSNADLLVLLSISERLGRLSRADSIKLNAYTTTTLPPDTGKTHHLVAVGTRDKFPFPNVLDSGEFRLGEAFSRLTSQASIQTLPDESGVIKEVLSPENSDRVLLALSAQTEEGLDQVRQVISQDPWFFQLQEDTVLISRTQDNVAAYNPDAYTLEFFQRAPAQKRLEDTNLLGRVRRYLQDNWLLLPIGIVTIALLLYGIAQLYLNRVTDKKSH